MRWFEGYLVPSRSTVFGLFLNIFAYPDFWPASRDPGRADGLGAGAHAARAGFGGRPLVLFGVTAALAGLTTLPWLTSILLTDIFAGLAVLAVHLLIFADHTLRRFEQIALFALVAFAVATHSATFAVILALLAAASLAWWFLRVGSAAGIARGLGALVLGTVMLLGANYAVAGRIAWTPGGLALSFGRIASDGIVNRYLNDHGGDGFGHGALQLVENRRRRGRTGEGRSGLGMPASFRGSSAVAFLAQDRDRLRQRHCGYFIVHIDFAGSLAAPLYCTTPWTAYRRAISIGWVPPFRR